MIADDQKGRTVKKDGRTVKKDGWAINRRADGDTGMKECTIYRITDLIGKKWTLCILHELYKDQMCPKRFNELAARMSGITPKILSLRLKELEAQGLLTKRITEPGSLPLRTEYELTGCGKELMGVVQQLKIWGNKWIAGSEACRHTICLECPR